MRTLNKINKYYKVSMFLLLTIWIENNELIFMCRLYEQLLNSGNTLFSSISILLYWIYHIQYE